MNGLTTIHLELTSRCDKACWMCGRRKLEREYPELVDWGDMDYTLVACIAAQTPHGIVVQFHNNGEPLMYPDLGPALALFKHTIRCFNTNAKLLLEKADEIIDNLDTLTISVVQGDPEQEEQYDTVRRFIEKKGSSPPNMVYRLLGNCSMEKRWQGLQGYIARRILHSPEGSFNYQKPVTIPEIGICLDFLTHLAIDRYGNVSPCVRFDPMGIHRIGNANHTPLYDLWNSKVRLKWLEHHKRGRRDKIELCSQCDYWGVPK